VSIFQVFFELTSTAIVLRKTYDEHVIYKEKFMQNLRQHWRLLNMTYDVVKLVQKKLLLYCRVSGCPRLHLLTRRPLSHELNLIGILDVWY